MKQDKKENKSADPQAEKRKKALQALGVLAVPFLAVMYLIFAGTKERDAAPGQGDINVTLPDGRGVRIEGSKPRALERLSLEDADRERTANITEGDFSLLPSETAAADQKAVGPNPVDESRRAHADAARVIGSFYASSRDDGRVAALERRIEELNEQLTEAQRPTAPDPIAVAEQRYALSTHYLPQAVEPEQEQKVRTMREQGNAVVPVHKITDQVASRLSADGIQASEGAGFITPAGQRPAVTAGAIRACIADEQTVTAGERVRLRLVDAVRVGAATLPAGSFIYGTASINGQRLALTVSSVECGGSILPVALTAYDTDGIEGIFVPDAAERKALKDAAASMSAGIGSGISITSNAGQQVAMDLTRSALSGASQYLSSKLREVRITLKAGHRLLLISSKS